MVRKNQAINLLMLSLHMQGQKTCFSVAMKDLCKKMKVSFILNIVEFHSGVTV